MTLALFPEEHIEDAFELLQNDLPEEIADFFKYFDKQCSKRMPKNIEVYRISWIVQIAFVKVMFFFEFNSMLFFFHCL